MSKRSIEVFAAALFAACAGSLALAAPPAPQLVASANTVKQLRFNWSLVSGAGSYELWFQSNATAAETRFFTMPSSQTSVINNVAVHLLDWNNGRYWLKACDSSGCTSSPRISVANAMPDTIGLFSSPSQQAASQFGYAVALSADGATLAVAAPFESTDNPQRPKGSAYIYRKSATGWTFQSALPFDVATSSHTDGVHLTLNRAGTVLAIGLPSDAPLGATTGEGHGAVKIFRLTQDDGWRHDATISILADFETGSADWLALDDAGMTLAVKTDRAGSGVFIYSYDNSGTWSHTGTANGHGFDVNDGDGCGRMAFSADGKVLAYACGSFDPADTVLEVHAAPTWGVRDTIAIPADVTFLYPQALDNTGNTFVLTTATNDTDQRAEIYRRVNGSYQRQAVLRPGAWQQGSPLGFDRFGSEVQLSADGKLLAIADPSDRGLGTGSLAPPLTAGTKATGAVYIYELRTNGWALRRVVKPGRAGAAYEAGSFGKAIAFGDNGKTLVVGQPAANNNAGVIWLY